MTDSDNRKQIKGLLKERNAILLAHNYTCDEVQDLADITGDSLGLSLEAAKTDAAVIVFCGVHFMAESAAILSPEKKVLLPRLDAGCPMADMVTVEGLEALKAQYPGIPVVTYVNSSAEIKAHSDICCTSANAVSVVRSLPDSKVIFAPDRNLGRYVASKVPEKELIFWDGFCPTHQRMSVDMVKQKKQQYPDALFVCHPECNPDVVALADQVCSTSGMYDFCRQSQATRFIIGTECGILYRLKQENPDKEFMLISPDAVCRNMKITSLEDVLKALQRMSPVVNVPEHVRIPALRALERMLAVPRD
ncbi:MAG TPA: quinolinate synthase NadA [Deltaproteobacteria bacterium]|nr:quinolinate synthase NadA [Deltaproteobacteria bacterium]HQB38172.1 quinolinate synthase NadA [Deltaproteobacteria bacterium]